MMNGDELIVQQRLLRIQQSPSLSDIVCIPSIITWSLYYSILLEIGSIQSSESKVSSLQTLPPYWYDRKASQKHQAYLHRNLANRHLTLEPRLGHGKLGLGLHLWLDR